MTEQEWLARLDAFIALDMPSVTDMASVFGAMLERINTVIVSYANRQHDDLQVHVRRLDVCREAVADLRTIIEDMDARIAALEQTRKVGGS